MQRSTARRRTSLVAIGLLATLGLGACSSDDDASSDVSVPDVTIPDITIADITVPDVSISEVTLPDGVTIPDAPAGLGEECQDYYRLFASAFTGGGTGLDDIDGAIDELETRVPDDLKEDVTILGDALRDLAELSTKYEGNPGALYADPDAQALFSDPAVTNATSNVNEWLENECVDG